MASDRATLANVLERLEEANQRLLKAYTFDQKKSIENVIKAQFDIWYCQGKIRGLLADPIPIVAERDAVDEANVEVGETWD